ncbi:hypothetical protein GE21DRAFT_1582 [Neurospora crassa]|uniref:Uncharacterized protein n=1 Tax=Neurospora crassa (strain ATCC 24698 / 74-OR23-1A / CBS 708.71 / DSM 1257 / FGSC 987) TaxID=367110 RepID=Q7S1F1_NEUCR|nr:hypothetical protein NCU07423 [Neurospora crassa OR74A]EAA29188.3 hypothetical protein NCU07423 [Neurospora crassa OR74A]KHE82600.1 hypothetical protein GE21DRAFT_1582 [Neurospora crassa]|eukprot:XP_958424.3 hypothetical protein NCU07423 [Neurospora crassa OR74A]
MLLRLVPRGRVGLFPGISPPSSQRAFLALKGSTTTYTPNLKHQVQIQYSTFRDNRRNVDGITDPEKALPRTVKCLSVAINPEAWDDFLSGSPGEIYKKRMNPRNPRVFISPAIRHFYQSILSHGPEVRADCLVILASLRYFQEVQCAHTFLFNTVNELFPRTEVGPLKDSEVLKDRLNVVTAVVDKIPLWQVPGYAPNATLASEGFSIICGQSEHLLPGLWDNSDFSWSNMRNETDPLFLERMYRRLKVAPKGNANVEKPMPYSSGPPPVLEFRINPLRDDNRPVQVALPLANTSYATSTAAQQRGTTPHVLEVSAWARSPEKQKLRPIHVEANTRTHVTIQTTSLKQPWPSELWFQLLPITYPRKIVSGLGNILKQVEIDGESAPASKELEDVIPKLLSMRASSHRPLKHTSDSHFVKVWALVIPDEVYQKYANFQPPLDLAMQLPSPFDFEQASTADEKRLAGRCSKALQGLLVAGCHLREILSGGGGWGAKQGLLSLDPQDRDHYRKTPTTSSSKDRENNEAEEEDDGDDMEGLERFLRTLRGEQNVGDIASPGSWVQFFVAPAHLERLPWDASKSVVNTRRPAEKLTLGLTDAVEEYTPTWDPDFTENKDSNRYKYLWRDPNGVEIFTYQFGALANGSLWLDLKKPSELTATTENSTTENSTNDTNNNGQEEKDLWKDLETDSERKITVPEFNLRADIDNPLYVAKVKEPGEDEQQRRKQPREEVQLFDKIRKIPTGRRRLGI